MTDLNRRLVLLSGAATASTVALPGWANAQTSKAAPPIKDPFQLGVASGDPLPDSVVLWTRLAPAPLDPDGLGGMPDAAYDVEWEIATDSGFSSVVRRGSVATTRAQAHSVHAEPTGLQAGTEYFYRFRVGGHISPVGRTRTAPALGASVSQLKFVFGSCQHWEEGWYHAYRGMAADQPDLILFLGDYVSDRTASARVREDAGPAGSTLATYRVRHAQHKTDANLQAAHAAAPWLVTAPTDQKGVDFQAFYEHMPVRSAAKSSYRQFGWGNLARFQLAETRDADQVRTAFETHPSTWDFLGQRTFLSKPEGDQRVTQGWTVPNPVVLTGDVRKHWAAELPHGAELVTASITDDPGPGGLPDATWFSQNPHVKYYRNQRGYVRVSATAQQAQADFVVVSDAAERDPAKVTLSTDARFVMQAGRPGLHRI